MLLRRWNGFPACWWVVCAVVFGQSSNVGERVCRASDPCIKCLDDLFHPFQADPTRDPWEERIETDRHDFTQSPKVVGRGVAQIEAGYTYFYRDQQEEIEQSHTTPELMLRLGVTDDIEFRIRWTYVWQSIAPAGGEELEFLEGGEDLQWSFKLALTDQDGFMPESALKLASTVPSGGSDWTTEHVEFGYIYIYDWTIADTWNVAGSTGMLTQGLDDFGMLPDEPADDRFVVWIQSVALGFELSARNTMYVEWFGEFSYGLDDEFTLSIFNVGIDHYVTDDLILDFRVGKGLTDDSDDLFAGVGGGFRF